jgi:HJR/Mrr/RecB family endonuclease
MVGTFGDDGRPLGERIAEVGFRREAGFFYYLKNGDIWRCSTRLNKKGQLRPDTEEPFVSIGLQEDREQFLYWIDTVGDIWRASRHKKKGRGERETKTEVLYSLFPHLSVPKATVHIQVIQDEATRLFDAICSRADLERISDRQLEIVLAEIFSREGYETFLTPPSHDGGRDVIAAKPGAVPLLILGEAKKHTLVKPSIIHSLAGVLDRDKANTALLATTGRFSANTRQEALNAWGTRIQLRDGDEMANWIKSLKR